MTKKTRKALMMVLCAVALVAISVGATVAYLTSTDSVTNTFTVGNVVITLDEAQVDVDGEPVTPAARVDANTYKLMPGHTYTKDPTIHVASTSEDCWLFVKVENGISAIEASTTIANQMNAKGWTPVNGQTNVYAYSRIAQASEDISVFARFTISGNADISGYASAQIKVTAYAVQADGFTTAEAAWNAAYPSTQGN